MQIIRRVYLYVLTAISLTMLTVGVINLLDLAFTQLLFLITSAQALSPEAGTVRQQVSLFTALVIPALPIWLLHWWLAERGRWGSAGEAERRSTLRALFLSVLMIVTFITAFLAAGELIDSGLTLLFRPGEANALSAVPGALARLLIAGGLWLYHGWVRRRDELDGPLTGGASALPRLVRYFSAAFGLLFLLFGCTNLLSLISNLILGGTNLLGPANWWVDDLASGISQVVTGGVAWLLSWRYAQRLMAGQDWLAGGEQQSLLRRVYLYLMILVGVGMTLTAISASLDAVLRWLFGVARTSTPLELTRQIIEPPLGVVPFMLAWRFHRAQVNAEAQRYGEEPLQATVRRLYTYAVSLAGLIFAAVGLAMILGLLFDQLLGSASVVSGDDATWWRQQISQFVAMTLVGGGVWVWQWFTAQRWLAQVPAAERGATTRRLYLFLVLAGSLVALLGGLAVIIYQLLEVLLGGTTSGLIANISPALGTALTATPLLIYHVLTLRADLAARAETIAEARLLVRLSGPPGADLTPIVQALREHLPPGYQLTAAGDAPPSAPPTRPQPTASPPPSSAGTANAPAQPS